MPGKQLSHGSHRGPGSHTASRPPSPRSLSTLSAPTLGIAPQCSHQQGPSCQQLKASTRYWAGQQPPRLRDEDQLAWSHGQPGTEARSLVMVPCSGPSRETCRCGLSRVHTRSQHGMWGDNPRERAARARADTRIRVHPPTSLSGCHGETGGREPSPPSPGPMPTWAHPHLPTHFLE